MRFSRALSAIFLAAFLFSSSGLVSAQSILKISDKKLSRPEFFPLEEIKPGLRGDAYTVFEGTVATPFDVEILGMIPSGIGPQQDLIVGRISGGGANRTQVFAGMSGSPVYIDGKLVGAISYSYPFSKEAICGITPISQMVEIFKSNSNEDSSPLPPRSYSFAELASISDFSTNGFGRDSRLSATINTSIGALSAQSFQPIASPLSFNGFSPSIIEKFSPQLSAIGLIPVAGIGANSPITPLKVADDKTLLGGDSVVMQLARGDYSFSAAGTVTLRDGGKIYAFGHPFLSLGKSSVPMSESHVIAVVPSVYNSFKLAVPDSMVGSMTQDRATGVFGKLGEAPKMIPVVIKVTTSLNQQKTYTFEIAHDDLLSPILLNIAMVNSLAANEKQIGPSTVGVKGKIDVKDSNPLEIERKFAGPSAVPFASGSVANPLNVILKSGFENVEIERIAIEMAAFDDVRTADLIRIGVDRNEVKAGQTLEVQAFVRTDSGQIFVQKIPVTIPYNTPAGSLTVTIGDGNAIQSRSNSNRLTPKNLAELIELLNSVKKSDRLYVQTSRYTKGAIIGGAEMSNLPPSVLATINNSRSSGRFDPIVQTVVTDEEIPPASFIISGSQSISVNVLND